MQGGKRKVVQALLYEVGAVGIVSPTIAWLFDAQLMSSTALAVTLSLIALLWNMVFNGLFEVWERRQPQRQRTLRRRLLHATGFEGGLTLLLVPVMAFWLDIGLLSALLAEAGLLVLFFVYALVFQWAFDRLFGLPVAVTG